MKRGQREAAWSIGLTGFTQFRRIIFPQAAVSALPNYTSVLIDLIKDTSLVYTITVVDVMAKANIAAARGFITWRPTGIVLIIYIALCLVLTRILRHIEAYLSNRWKSHAPKVVPSHSFWGKKYVQNKVLMLGSLLLAMQVTMAQAAEKSANAQTVEVVVNANGFPFSFVDDNNNITGYDGELLKNHRSAAHQL
ncbi:L-cystine transport system permease protein tcyL [Raoultella terrigena]|uniref:L-cystine transport system permease protein tcyL n=1 Tax=Raoultella terrigena TaxID=577 RepID=A0A4U9CW96_RAOTE|nr:L-cystine transport system permease protein tcyL [Raoultella terrigena]